MNERLTAADSVQRFRGKTVVVTGGSSGIGEGCARRFSAEGANVVLVARGRERLDAVAATLDASRTLAFAADVSRRDEVDAMVAATLARFGRIDVLHGNAGISISKSFAQTTPEEWRATMAIDVDGLFHCAQAVLPALRPRRGCIVFTASVSGTGGDWGMPAYNAAKGAVVNLTRALALELGADGIRVNAVAPSLTRSGMTGDIFGDADAMAKFRERIPLRRHAEPEDIAGPVAFLASDDARFVTGAILPVDGGVSASNGQPAM